MNTQPNKTIIRGALRRPNWLCRNAKQNVVLVRDMSGSMSGEPANQASAASLDLVAELAQPSNKDGFNVAVVDFAGDARTVHPLIKATDLNGRVAPLRVGGG